ncbi:MAG: PEFG-CTERM sorting domain-containing protein, partial [Candidatus Nitrosotenuis sp.]
KGLTGKITPWFANLGEDADHDIHDIHDAHTSTIRDTGFEIKFNGGTKVLTYNNMDFPIKYEMAGAIAGLEVNEESKSITLLLEYVVGGELTLRIPRTLIDAIDDNFVVFASASPQKQIDYDIISSTSDYYTLKMNLPENTRTLTIVGSKVVPEFGTLAILVLVSALFAVLIKTSNRFTSRFS